MHKILGFMPTLGRPALVENVLAMWEMQTYPNRELLVYDTANQMPQVSGYKWRIVHQGKLPFSMGTTCNTGIRMSDAPLICRIDDDDVYMPWHVEACVDALAKAPWVCPYAVWDKWESGKPPKLFKTYGNDPRDVCYAGAWAFTREAFETVGGYYDKNFREDECEFRDRLYNKYGNPADTLSERFPLASYYYPREATGYVHYGHLTDEERREHQRRQWPKIDKIQPRFPKNYMLGFPEKPKLEPRPW